MLKDQESIKKRWKEYFGTLYNAAGKPTACDLEKEDDVHEDNKGPLILLSETNASINKLKNGKKHGIMLYCITRCYLSEEAKYQTL